MANKVQFDESAIEADTTTRAAAVIAVLIRSGTASSAEVIAQVAAVMTALIRSGALQWSSVAGAPVTGRRDELAIGVEDWLRHG
jgi:hypothetical protein